MKTRTYMAGTLSLMINAVLFGVGTIAVLSIPALTAYATILIPAVIITSLVITPFIAWKMAPHLRLTPSLRDA
ncbi:MAG: hypothetical protein CML29_16505 [Rhizobiales bacterium]|nr:hypothetical protein [Hyphomicrobiales bacterium]MBA67620.1 hypothetical protein [Hyphomicrobiales bacterium]|tara:strand:+ start:727 stop:945 length:219 start_codon:yes stop_codon:yes gene_type:complete